MVFTPGYRFAWESPLYGERTIANGDREEKFKTTRTTKIIPPTKTKDNEMILTTPVNFPIVPLKGFNRQIPINPIITLNNTDPGTPESHKVKGARSAPNPEPKRLAA
jgi:hypothetical protein